MNYVHVYVKTQKSLNLCYQLSYLYENCARNKARQLWLIRKANVLMNEEEFGVEWLSFKILYTIISIWLPPNMVYNKYKLLHIQFKYNLYESHRSRNTFLQNFVSPLKDVIIPSDFYWVIDSVKIWAPKFFSRTQDFFSLFFSNIHII